ELRPVLMPAILATMRILDLHEVEKLFPVRALFDEWRQAKTGFNPMSVPILGDTRVLHIVQILISSDRAFAQASIFNSLHERFLLARLYARFNQISHNGNLSLRTEVFQQLDSQTALCSAYLLVSPVCHC